MIRYKVTLTEDERNTLEDILKKGKHSSLEFRNACILLNSDEGEFGPKESLRNNLTVSIFCIIFAKWKMI